MGLFGKKKGLVGVDIGSSAVKAVELKVGGKGGDEYQLLNIGIESLPPSASRVVNERLGGGVLGQDRERRSVRPSWLILSGV